MNKTQRKKAVAIAQDVLLQIKHLRIVSDTYFEIDGESPITSETEGESLQQFIPQLLKDKKCSVCALGACFISHVKLYNHFDINYDMVRYQAAETSDMFGLLKESLGNRNMALIESAFECEDFVEDHFEDQLGDSDGYYPVGHPKREKFVSCAELLAAISFGKKYEVEDKRLAAIMRNVIKNDGEFVVIPSKKHIQKAAELIEIQNDLQTPGARQ